MCLRPSPVRVDWVGLFDVGMWDWVGGWMDGGMVCVCVCVDVWVSIRVGGLLEEEGDHLLIVVFVLDVGLRI